VQSYFLRLSKVYHIFWTLICPLTVEADSQNSPTLDQRSNKKLSTTEFNPEIIQKHLEKLKVTNSSGPDQLHPKFLNETSKSISTPLAHIFNRSMQTGKLPDNWKKANVTPLHKKGLVNSTHKVPFSKKKYHAPFQS
jgi:hypothetical protein